MVQRGRGSRFLLEALQPITVARERRRQNLDGDVAVEARIAGAIHLAHSAGADGVEDLIGSDARTGTQRHGLRDDRATAAVRMRLHFFGSAKVM
jgi:hypothetical protein